MQKSRPPIAAGRLTVLSGGVGGARMIHGLNKLLAPHCLSVIVNTGDDFDHWGLRICPDLDTVMYTLADAAPVERGWGLEGETFHALEMVERYSGASWFGLGDRDLGTHLMRTEALRRGESLSSITQRLCECWGIHATILPMCDEPKPTLVDTESHGTLGFQQWFVRHRAQPPVSRVYWETSPRPAPGVIDAILSAEAVILAPSNPYVSIDPILTLPGITEALSEARRVVAISPLIHGQAIKGPLGGMIRSLEGAEPGVESIARHYLPWLKGLVVQEGDSCEVEGLSILETDILMPDREGSLRLAGEVLRWLGLR